MIISIPVYGREAERAIDNDAVERAVQDLLRADVARGLGSIRAEAELVAAEVRSEESDRIGTNGDELDVAMESIAAMSAQLEQLTGTIKALRQIRDARSTRAVVAADREPVAG